MKSQNLDQLPDDVKVCIAWAFEHLISDGGTGIVRGSSGVVKVRDRQADRQRIANDNAIYQPL